MNINDYISQNIKPLSLKSTVKSAQKLCEEVPNSHFPVIENGRFLGCFPERDIRTIENKNRELSDYSYLLDQFFATEKTPLLDLITLFADNDCNLIPVLDKDKNYIGYYELSDILDAFADSPFLHNESETIVVEKNKEEYSMSEISQIVESSSAKLLGMYISSQSSDAVKVTLKIVSEEVNEIIQTFRRYNYNIITIHKDDVYLEDLKNRSDYLKKYLEM